MKIILNEQQFNRLVTEEVMISVLNESIFEKGDFKLALKSIRNAIIGGVAAATIIAAIGRANMPSEQKDRLVDEVNKIEMAINGEKQENTANLEEKIRACEEYMAYALKNQGYTLKSTKLKPETLVKVATENNFDLPFLMAAAHDESCFGANKRAQRTNSVFSVGSYDDGRNVVTYSDPNDSVADYISLLERRYLRNGKTIFDLLVPGQFVDVDGHRYAGNKNYENELKSIRNRILKMFPVLGS